MLCLSLVFATTGACAPRGPTSLLALRRVVLNQSGSGYFERSGVVSGDQLTLRLRPHEVDDVLATLTVIERGAQPGRTVVAAGVAHARSAADASESVGLELRLPDARPRDLSLSYAVATPNWQTTYRVVLPERDGAPAMLQAWALVHNASDEDWSRVELTLATSAPLSYALSLRAPSFAARPDASGRLVAPVAYGPIAAEVTRGPSGEARGSSEGADADRDRIPDAADRCPEQPETYNGLEDEDGCPDRGQVTLEEQSIRILESVSFSMGSAELSPASAPMLAALARTLQGNPQITAVEVQGNASEDEPSAWTLAADRASTVRARLISLGVEPRRLLSRSYGATRPRASGNAPGDLARNRAVTFHIASTADDEANARAAAGPVTAAAVAASAAPAASAQQVSGATQYTVSSPVSIRAGSAALVTLASRAVPGEVVYLFRPEAAAPSSSAHPYRAVLLRNALGMTLLPGSVALFAGGTFAGQGLMPRLDDGATTFVPYAIDTSTDIQVTTAFRREPSGVVSAQREQLVLEDTAIHSARYAIHAGAQAPSRVYLRNARLAGFEPRGLPPGTERTSDADVAPVPLEAGRDSVVTLEQTRAVQRRVSLTDELEADLAPYLERTPDPARSQLRAALQLRAELARAEREAREHREQLADVSDHGAELRDSLRTLSAVTDASRVALRAQLTQQLQASSQRAEALSRELSLRTATAATVRARLLEALRTLRFE